MTDNSIDIFLEKNKNKKVVVVQGLGFVGAVMSIVCANSETENYAVIGVDIPKNIGIIEKLNKGEFPIKSIDPKIQEYYENSRKKGNFLATCNNIAYSYADTVIVDINLDVKKESDNNDDKLNVSINYSEIFPLENNLLKEKIEKDLYLRESLKLFTDLLNLKS